MGDDQLDRLEVRDDRRGPWRGLDDLELATLEWIDWYNHKWLHSALDYRAPAEYGRNQERELVPAGVETQ